MRRHPEPRLRHRSILSIGSTGSILSIGSTGSILSIGSAGSILSIGSAGSLLSLGSAGSVLSIGSVGSLVSWRAVASLGSPRSLPARHSAPAARSPGQEPVPDAETPPPAAPPKLNGPQRDQPEQKESGKRRRQRDRKDRPGPAQHHRRGRPPTPERRWQAGAVFERFSDRSRRVLALAQEEARLLHHGFVGTEHLLLGLVREGGGIAARALDSLGVTLEGVRAGVEDTVPPSAGPSATASPPFTPRAKKALELALHEEQQLGDEDIGTEHLLLGIVRQGDGVAAQVLVGLGVDLDEVRRRVLDLRAEACDDGSAGKGALPDAGRDPRWHPEPLTRPRRPPMLVSFLPPVVVGVAAGVVGFAAAWVAGRRALHRTNEQVADLERRLAGLQAEVRVGNRRHRRPAP